METGGRIVEEINEKLNAFKENPKKYIKEIGINIIVFLVAIAYVFYNMVRLEFNNINPFLLIAQSVVSIVAGVLIKQALGENGFSKGYNSSQWQNEEDMYNDACKMANEYMNRQDNFNLYEIKEKKETYRREYLQSALLVYNEWFDEQGNCIATKEMFDKLDKRQRKIVSKCIKVKIVVLDLFSQNKTNIEQFTKDQEKRDSKQRSKNLTKNIGGAAVISCLGTYLIPILTMNWAGLISSIIQVLIWVIFGFIQMHDNYYFVIFDKVAVLRKKKELIKKFMVGCEKGMYLTSPYDVQKQVDITTTPMVS